MLPYKCLMCKWARVVSAEKGVCVFYECVYDEALIEARKAAEEATSSCADAPPSPEGEGFWESAGRSADAEGGRG